MKKIVVLLVMLLIFLGSSFLLMTSWNYLSDCSGASEMPFSIAMILLGILYAARLFFAKFKS